MPQPAASAPRHPVPAPALRPALRPAPRRALPPARPPVIYVVRGRPGPADRPALPPGSPESWGAITRNTLLDHAPYPFPVFPACR